MYTRCPSCRSEISFEPPANLNNLPEGYKHRIRCPNCGVTIGVKIPRQEAYLEAQPTYTPSNPNATSFEPVYNAGTAQSYADESAAAAKPAKKKGTGRNVFMLTLSLLLVAVSVVGYLIKKNIIPVPGELVWLVPFYHLDGISCWELLFTDFEAMQLLFTDAAFGIATILPMILFGLAVINLLVSLISLFGGKYGRAYNVVMSLLIAVVAVCCIFKGWFMYPDVGIGEYFKQLIESQFYVLFAVAALGVIQFVFSLFFIKSLVKKEKKL